MQNLLKCVVEVSKSSDNYTPTQLETFVHLAGTCGQFLLS